MMNDAMKFVSEKVCRVISDWSDRPFAYGADCCQFAGAVVEAATGHNPMDAFEYTDERSALKVIARFGRLEDAMTATLSNPIPVDQALENDVVLIEMTNGKQMAGAVICGRAVVKDETGIRDLNLGTAKLAWRT